MNTERGVFFVIEGTDGSGKATQFALLKQKLEQTGYEVEVFDFPQYAQPSSHFVRRYLKGDYGTAEQVGPYTGSLFYALDRYEAAQQIREALDAGKIVLANRFTASNMSHHGSKFSNVEQRRGFYIWLDNLEFMLLQIPRPDVSVVLRVSATIARGMLEKRVAESGGTKSLDIHEADMSHLEASVKIYEELCQLFPRDFRQIDCVRNNAMMSINHVQQMVWEKLQPYLPPVPAKKATKVTPKIDSVVVASSPIAEDTQHITISSLLATQTNLLSPEAKQPTRNGTERYYVLSGLSKELRQRYIEVMDSLFELHAEIEHRLPKEHKILAESVLPVSTVATYALPEHYEKQLRPFDSAEARAIRTELDIKPSEGPSAFTRGNTIGRMASDLLPTNYASSSPESVRLVSVLPRNELVLVPTILYPSANLPLIDIRLATNDWPYEQKTAIYLAYLAIGDDTANALASIQYTWDVLASFTAIRDILRQFEGIQVSTQVLTPRHGYDVPEAIEEAGLTELYERSFEISLELYSELQAAGLHNEAQYSTLHGHIARTVVQMNGLQARKLRDDYTCLRPETVQTIDKIKQIVIHTHPLLGSDL